MATPPNATNPTNDAFAGGTYAPASNPVNAGGTFGGPGAASTPPNVATPNILSAQQLGVQCRGFRTPAWFNARHGRHARRRPANPPASGGALCQTSRRTVATTRSSGALWAKSTTAERESWHGSWVASFSERPDEATHLENGTTPFRAISSSAHVGHGLWSGSHAAPGLHLGWRHTFAHPLAAKD